MTTFASGWTIFGKVRHTAEVRPHLAQCRACAGYYRDLRLVRSGFRLLKLDEAPEPSLGFAERLVRQLGRTEQGAERGGVFRTSGKALRVCDLGADFPGAPGLGVAVDGAGPRADLRRHPDPAQEAALAYSDPVGETGVQEAPDLAPWNAPAPAVTNEVK